MRQRRHVDAQPFLELSAENWQNHLDINLTGCFQFDA